jgi:hypothetical protein
VDDDEERRLVDKMDLLLFILYNKSKSLLLSVAVQEKTNLKPKILRNFQFDFRKFKLLVKVKSFVTKSQIQLVKIFTEH